MIRAVGYNAYNKRLIVVSRTNNETVIQNSCEVNKEHTRLKVWADIKGAQTKRKPKKYSD